MKPLNINIKKNDSVITKYKVEWHQVEVYSTLCFLLAKMIAQDPNIIWDNQAQKQNRNEFAKVLSSQVMYIIPMFTDSEWKKTKLEEKEILKTIIESNMAYFNKIKSK